MKFRHLAVLAAATAALSGVALPAAHANPVSPGHIHLKASVEGPIVGDDDDLIYNAHIVNLGPDTATGVVVRVTGWFCEGRKWSQAACEVLPDREDPSKPMVHEEVLDSLAPGQRDSFPVTAYLPDEQPGSVRTTIEVVRTDQVDYASVPGICTSGWVPEDDCSSSVTYLS